jgi:hypothetical protein
MRSPTTPDDLQQDLHGPAGPSAGPNGGEIFVDGFSGGPASPKKLDPRDSSARSHVISLKNF